MKIRSPLIRRSAQEIIASLPSIIAIDGEHCRHNTGQDVIVVKPGETGYYAPPYAAGKTLAEVDAIHARIFNARKPTDAEREAASIGSMMGWEVPGADPQNYQPESDPVAMIGRGPIVLQID